VCEEVTDFLLCIMEKTEHCLQLSAVGNKTFSFHLICDVLYVSILMLLKC
jgi:hypothetical protein